MNRDDRRLRHQDAWELLPWYANGTLDSDERRAVEAHLERCGLCRGELAASRDLAAAVRRAADVPPAAETRLGHLLDRLDAAAAPGSPALPSADAPPAAASSPAAGGRAVARLPNTVRWALALQAAAILALALGLAYLLARPAPPAGTVAAAPAPEPAFRTLAASPAAAGRELAVRAVFSPTASERELRHLLLAAGARFDDGPSPAGVYTLEIGGGDEAAAAALERLRRDPLVELAEPVVVTPSGGGR